jgi:hypothetical protein
MDFTESDLAAAKIIAADFGNKTERSLNWNAWRIRVESRLASESPTIRRLVLRAFDTLILIYATYEPYPPEKIPCRSMHELRYGPIRPRSKDLQTLCGVVLAVET